jgi:hypothetical protein
MEPDAQATISFKASYQGGLQAVRGNLRCKSAALETNGTSTRTLGH